VKGHSSEEQSNDVLQNLLQFKELTNDITIKPE
jgi:hypothetical protein